MEFNDVTNLLEFNFPYFDFGSHKSIIMHNLGQPEGVFIRNKNKIAVFKYGPIQLTFFDDFLLHYNFHFAHNVRLFSLKDIYDRFPLIKNGVIDNTHSHLKIYLKNGFTLVFDKEQMILENIIFGTTK